MIINLSNYVKNNLFNDLKIEDKFAVVSDYEFTGIKSFYKIDTIEPVGQIVALKEKYKLVFVVLNRLNWDNLYRLYKYDLNGVCILNLNSGYTGIGKKTIMPDLDDIYIKSHVKVLEPMDKENLLFFIKEFLLSKGFFYIRIPDKELEEKIGNEEVNLEYKEIINFNQFGITGFNGTILVYGSMLQESINVSGLLQSEGIGMDMFWIGNYKQNFTKDLIDSLDNQDKVFVIGDFYEKDFRDFVYSKFYDSGLVKEEVYFITPRNINKQVIKEFLGESTEMDPVKIYERIKSKI